MKKIYPHKIDDFKIISRYELLSKLGILEKELSLLLLRIPKCYFPIKLKKRSGGFRDIFAPNKRLKQIQKSILVNFLEKIELPKCVFGGLKGKSIIENAKQHISGRYLLNIDIKSFFPSVHWKIITKLFLDLGCSDETTKILTRLTTLNWSLPQGAPTIPYLANLVLTNLDYRFYNLCKSNRLIYTRYFDDISISGDKRIELLRDRFLRIIQEEGYRTKPSKIVLYSPSEIKKITGILIRDKQLDIEDKGKLLNYITALSRNGLIRLGDVNLEKEKQSLIGKINFVKSIDFEFGEKLKRIFFQIKWV